jgi:hypothetical protein
MNPCAALGEVGEVFGDGREQVPRHPPVRDEDAAVPPVENGEVVDRPTTDLAGK